MIGFAVSAAGHDMGTLYLVVGAEKNRFLLADGKHHKLDNLKRKNVKHLTPLPESVYEQYRSRVEREELTDAEVRRVLATIKTDRAEAIREKLDKNSEEVEELG